MHFNVFAQYLQKLEKTSSRLAMTAQLADLFKKLGADEVAPACYLMQGKLVPKYQSLEFNLSVKMLIRALARLQGNQPSAGARSSKQATAGNNGSLDFFSEPDYSVLETEVKKIYQKLGDLGLAAEEILKNCKSCDQNMSITQVHQVLVSIAQDGGVGSQDRKVQAAATLLAQLDSISAKFIVRIIIGKLRLGFSTMTMLDALSWTKHADKSDSQTLEQAYQKKADVGMLAAGYLSAKSAIAREKFLSSYEVEVGVPVIPALCQRLNSAAEIIDKLGEVIAEPKYDGLRVQIHIDKQGFIVNKRGLTRAGVAQARQVASARSGKSSYYRVFTRNLDNASHMFPEIEQVLEKLDCQSCILDAEAVGVDKKTGALASFQTTSTRRRKHGVGQKADELPIQFYLFDILSLDGKSLIDQPLAERKQVLANLLGSLKSDEIKSSEIFAQKIFIQAPSIVTSDASKLKTYHEDLLKQNLEGAVIKRGDSLYRSGRKGWRWVKIKEEEGSRGKLSDTLDLVVMGYYYGRGKRSNFGIGAFLAGVLDKGGSEVGSDAKFRDDSSSEQIKTIAKIGTGLTDDHLRDMKKRCEQHQVDKRPNRYQVHKNLVPDVWVQPAIVVEIAADEITKSPVHSAGVALRFPRLVKFREDKDWEQATTVEELTGI